MAHMRTGGVFGSERLVARLQKRDEEIECGGKEGEPSIRTKRGNMVFNIIRT